MSDMSGLRNPKQWLINLFGGGKSKVTHKTPYQTAPFWYGINKISGNIGTLPLNVMRRLSKGSEKDRSHIAWRAMRRRPNRYQTPFVFKQTETARAINWGNSRSYIHRDGGRIELLPLRPDATITGMVDGQKWHLTYPEKDDCICGVPDLLQSMQKNPKKAIPIKDDDCLHILGFGDGICGYSLWEVARLSLEVYQGANKRSARQMQKGHAGKLMLEIPANSPLARDQEQAEEFLREFNKTHGTEGDGNDVGLLRAGITANVLQMSNRDAEFVEQRKFERQEAALWLMLESILGDDNSVSYNSEEQKQLAYLKNCLSNWLARWEQECEYKLLSTREFDNDTHFFKFNTAALLRPDFPTTVDTLCKGITHRLWNPNEARERIDMNPYEGGDTYENPAISPGKPGDGDGGNDAAIESRLKHMLGIEQKQVQKFIDNGHSFDHISTWYDKWATTLGQVVEELGGDFTAAQNHCVRSLNYLKGKPESFDLTGSHELIMEDMKR